MSCCLPVDSRRMSHLNLLMLSSKRSDSKGKVVSSTSVEHQGIDHSILVDIGTEWNLF